MLAELRCALGVDEVDACEVEHERVGSCRRPDQLADAVLERFGGGEEQAAVEAQTTMPGNVSSSGYSSSSRNTCVPGSRPSSGIAGGVAT